MAHTSTLPRASSPPAWAVWLGFVVLCNATGLLSALVAPASSIYTELPRPSFAPPGWVFGPVWTLLYTLMGTAAFLVWQRRTGEPRRSALIVFGIQLALNAAWTPVFFGLQLYVAAFVVLLAIWVAVGVMTVMFFRRVPLAGALLVPLWVWVTFAAVLNGAIVYLAR